MCASELSNLICLLYTKIIKSLFQNVRLIIVKINWNHSFPAHIQLQIRQNGKRFLIKNIQQHI